MTSETPRYRMLDEVSGVLLASGSRLDHLESGPCPSRFAMILDARGKVVSRRRYKHWHRTEDAPTHGGARHSLSPEGATRIQVTMPKDLLGEVDAYATAQGENRSEIIRLALAAYLYTATSKPSP